ncbi:prepilin-type N-terminal cleavage/methylation domain-containing protein [Candidatus Sumerlaeota bacterium]|nr:prepilin-type N-terminal cleavage/methylation domain-containing protein [Candidatus Sumerlaeota bacterium]
MDRMRKENHAFTLIELLIVVAIIAILSAIAIPNFLEAQVRAKVSRVKSDIRSFTIALESYCTDHNHYPPDRAVYGVQFVFELSTPVAYMTNSYIRDPFKPERYQGYGLGEGWAQTYHYTNYKGYWQICWHPHWPRKGCVVSSFGPAKHHSFVEHYPYYYNHPEEPVRSDWPESGFFPPVHFQMVYDPTNGTVSRGGLGRAIGELECPPNIG